ncbi:MAG: DUF2155 domain-containing protein [Nitrospirae bacterium]|nr:DUF2155 domain-containing protein [Nitrospirota bacterium]
MKKQILVAVCGIALVLSFGACKKKEEKPQVPQAGEQGQLPPGHPPMPGAQGGQGGQQVTMPKGQTTVSLPDAVKGKWKAVVLVVEDKGSKKKSEYTINVNSDFKVPGSNLKLAVSEFIPDFKMDGLTITSLSNEPNNPAVGLKVLEDEKEVFKGWLYSKFPAIHPFEHPKYAIMLKSGIKK